MKTQFDKIYVISLITNKDRQEFIKYQMNELGIEFEFIYGVDFYNLKYDRHGNEINYPNLIFTYKNLNNSKMYGCTIGHYQAILQAYEFGYNNVLIFEDDACLINDKHILENYLNNVPDDADFITYTARFINKNEVNLFHNELNDKIKLNCITNYIKLDNTYKSLCGCGMYGIMNRNTMKLYLHNQRNNLRTSDHIQNLFKNPIVNRYTTINAICSDQFNILKKDLYNDNDDSRGILCYKQQNIINDYNNFFHPQKFNLSNININLELSLKDDNIII